MKATNALLIFFVFTVSGCLAQKTEKTTEEEERRNASCLDQIQLRINLYADQLNFWKKDKPLPEFILDPQLDVRLITNLECTCDKKYFSYRKYILNQVVNEDVLTEIVSNNNPRLDSVYIPSKPASFENVNRNFYENFPYRTHSTRALAQKRLKQIIEIKNNSQR